MEIKTPADFGRALRNPYAWPGGYPTYFITSDCAALCHDCAKEQGHRITASIRDRIECKTKGWSGGGNDGWRVVAQDVNWESTDLYCDHCSKAIESAYGETEQEKLDAQVARHLQS